MFFFHEGLPGSGKSYEAVTKHLVEALTKGRPVDAYIEGLNHEKLAELAGITVEQCRELLVQVDREDVPDIWRVSRDNALVFIDEMQNFWPSNKQKLGPEITQFITEHRHRGQDICGMGQDIRDVHAMWRRRCGQKIVFSKLDGLGRADRYSYRVYKAVTPEKYELISKGVGKYDPKFFGSYASHTGDEINTENYKDSRAVIWNTFGFKTALPVFGVLLLAACWYLYGLLWGGKLMQPEDRPAAATSSKPIQAREETMPAAPVQRIAPESPPQTTLADYVQDISSRWRPRLSAYVSMGDRRQGLVEWFDSSLRKQEQLTLVQLSEFGYEFDYSNHILEIRKSEFELKITSWPMESIGKLSERQNEEVRGK